MREPDSVVVPDDRAIDSGCKPREIPSENKTSLFYREG